MTEEKKRTDDSLTQAVCAACADHADNGDIAHTGTGSENICNTCTTVTEDSASLGGSEEQKKQGQEHQAESKTWTIVKEVDRKK